MYFINVVFPDLVDPIKQNEHPPVLASGNSNFGLLSSILLYRYKIMDLLRAMTEKRKTIGMVVQTVETTTKMAKNDELEVGTKAYKKYIIDKKPSAKKVKKHFEALAKYYTETSSDSD